MNRQSVSERERVREMWPLSYSEDKKERRRWLNSADVRALRPSCCRDLSLLLSSSTFSLSLSRRGLFLFSRRCCSASLPSPRVSVGMTTNPRLPLIFFIFRLSRFFFYVFWKAKQTIHQSRNCYTLNRSVSK